jgi:hypothetical protein
VETPRNEHRALRWKTRRSAFPVLVSLLLALGAATLVRAQDPPQPDFYWPYGRVQLNGENIDPAVQPVIGIVNGRACGEASTLVATEGDGVPEGDVGKTVYVVDIVAEGSGAGHRLGCGRAGDSVMLYFPESRRLAQQQPLFFVGGQRVDVDLGAELSFRLQGPMVASDGVN